MTLRRIAASSAASALICVAVFAPRDAMASIHNCQNPTLLPDDEARLVAVARTVLPLHAEPIMADRCRWSDSAFAWVITAKVTEANGVAHWWMSSCARDKFRWTCDAAVFHEQFETSFVVGGAPQHAKINFDAQTNLATAKRVASEALDIYANPKATIPYCGGITGQEPRWPVLRESHPLPSASEELHITVARESTRISVRFFDLVLPDDVQIGIDFPSPDPRQSGPCWRARGP
jgi:hypothetical protein